MSENRVQWKGVEWDKDEKEMYEGIESKVAWTAEELLQRLEKGQEWSIGFQVIMTILNIDDDKQGFTYEESSEGEIVYVRLKEIQEAYKAEYEKDRFRWLPCLC
jgi:hypothetical protein